jgi:diaminopimelate decarboxylase
MRPHSLDDGLLTSLAREHGTPLFVYDFDVVKERIRELKGFDVIRYAQKANSNLALLRAMREERVLVDAVSAGEIARALAAGYEPGEIAFTADLFDRAALEMIAKHPVEVNLGSPDMIAQYARVVADAPRAQREERVRITLRVNPGFGHGHARKVSTGGAASKHGIWHEELGARLEEARKAGLHVTGLHVHIGSGSDLENLMRVCDALRALAPLVGDTLETISSGGGLPIPYREDEQRIDVAKLVRTWQDARDAMQRDIGREIALEVEPGRYLVAECGVLLTEVRATKSSVEFDYILVDAGFNNLVRPALYGAHHRISILGHGAREPLTPKVVAGPLCESADVFTQGEGGELEPQLLPAAREGDLACIHDAGAYGASMASNYNSQPFAAEVMIAGGKRKLVRRRQTIDELMSGETDSEVR